MRDCAAIVGTGAGDGVALVSLLSLSFPDDEVRLKKTLKIPSCFQISVSTVTGLSPIEKQMF